MTGTVVTPSVANTITIGIMSLVSIALYKAIMSYKDNIK